MYFYILYKIGQFIALNLPLTFSYKIAVFISDLRYYFSPQDRSAVTANLKVIFPQKSEKEIAEIRINAFRNFAKYLVDFFRFSKLDKDYVKKNIRLENSHYFIEALAKGKGVVVVTAHLGNWELGGAVIAILGHPFWAVAMPHKYKRVDNFFNCQRRSKGIKVIPLGRAVRQCLDVIRKNEMVALLGDRDFSGKGLMIDFFGQPAFLPEGPAALSLKTGAVILPGFMFRNKDDSLTLRMEPCIEPKNREAKGQGESAHSWKTAHEQDLRELIERYKAIIEDYIRKYPDQWYMFRRFWAT